MSFIKIDNKPMNASSFYRLIVTLFAVCVIAGIGGADAFGQAPAKVAFKTQTYPFDIGIVNSDGTGRQNLGVTAYFPYRVALGPGAEWVAFEGGFASESGIYVMRAEPLSPTNQPVKVDTDSWGLGTIAWHPGGKHLAWVGPDDVYYPQIYIAEVIDGSGAITPTGPSNPQIALTQRGPNGFYCEDPAFSPDGKWLATVRGAGSIALLKIRDETGEITPESSTNTFTSVVPSQIGNQLYPLHPSWSPNGRDLVFVQRRALESGADECALVKLPVLSAEGTPTPENSGNPRSVLIAPTSNPNDYTVAFPSWSADGTLIAFQSLKLVDGQTYPTSEVATILTSSPEGPSNLRQIIVPIGAGGGKWPTFPVNAVNFGAIQSPTWQDPITTAEPYMTGRNWRFHARNESRPDFPGMTARVQFSATPEDPDSWLDLGEMRTSGSLRFILDTSYVPVGSFAFRIVTSVPGVGTTYSDASPIYNIIDAEPVLETELDVSSASDPSGDTTHRGDLLTYTLRFRNSGGASYGAMKARIVYPRNNTTNFPVHLKPEAAKTTPGGLQISGGEDFAWEWSIPSVRPVGQTPYGEARNTTKVVKRKGKKTTVYDKTIFSMPNDPAHGYENGDVLRLLKYFTTPLPSGLIEDRDYFVVNATAGQFQLAASAGGSPLLLTGIANRVAPLHFERTNEWQTRTISFRLADPTAAQEAAQANAGLPTINAEGGVITARARVLTATLSEVDSVYSAPTTLVNPLSLTIERVFGNGPLEQGEMVTFNLIAKNNSSLRLAGSSVVVTAPLGLALQGAGDFPVFLDEGGQPAGPPIDPATNRQVVRPASWKTNPELLEAEIPGLSANSFPTFEQQARFYFGALEPGQVRKMRVTCRVQYDWDTVSDPEIAFEHDDAVLIGKLGATDWNRQNETEVELTVEEAAPGSAKPSIAIWVSQTGTGVLPEDRRIATVASAQGLAGIPQVPGSTPQRGINEIVYRATYANFGTASANYVRIWMPIPEGTEYVRATQFRTETRYKKKRVPGKKTVRIPYKVQVPYTVESARIIQAANDSDAIPAPSIIGGGTWFTCLVPFLDTYPDAGWLKSLEFRVKLKPGVAVGSRVEMSAGFATSRELFYAQAPNFAGDEYRELRAEVVPPADLDYQFDEIVQITKDVNGNPNGYAGLAHRAIFHNRGGIAATGVGLQYVVPHGFTFRDARYIDTGGVVVRSTGIDKPAVGSGGGSEIVFNTGTVAAGGTGIAEVLLDYDRNSFPDEDTNPTAGSRGGMTTAAFIPYDDANPLPSPSVGEDGVPQESLDLFGSFPLQSGAIFANTARPFVGVIAPPVARPNQNITYRILVGNHSKSGTDGGGFLHVRIPYGTTYVGSSVVMEQGGAQVLTLGTIVSDPNSGTAAQLGLDNPNGSIAHSISLAPNSCVAIDFTVQVNANAPTDLVMLGPGFGGKFENSRVTVSPVSCEPVITPVALAGTLDQQRIFESQVGAGAADALGAANSTQGRFVESRNGVTESSVNMSFGGTDLVTVPGHNLALIPLGGGRLVAAGGGNLVGNDGASVIVGSGSALVAAGGGNLVAAGGGNLITLDIPGVGRMTAQSYFAQLPQLVAAGAGNILDGRGLNLVQRLIGLDGGTLIGLDGATLIGLDGGTLATISQTTAGFHGFRLPGGSLLAVQSNVGNLVAAGGGNLVAAGGGNLVAAGGGNLVAAGGGNLVAAGGGNILSTSQLNLVPGSTLVAAGGGNLVAAGGGNLVAAGGGNVVPTGGGSFISTNGGNLVAAGGGNLVAAGGGNVIYISAGLVAAGGGN